MYPILFALFVAAAAVWSMFRQRSRRIDRDAHMLRLGATDRRSDYLSHGGE